MGVVTNEDGSPKWFSYMKKDRRDELNAALSKTAESYNVPTGALQLGSDWSKDDDGSFDFIDMPEGTLAQSRFRPSWFSMLGLSKGKKPTIELNKKSKVDQKDLNHEFDHVIERYLAALNSDGTVREGWGKPRSRTISGYKSFDQFDGKPDYNKDYDRLKSYTDRLKFFTDKVSNHPDNRQRPALLKALSSAVGGVLSDDLLHTDSKARPTDSGEYYATGHKEKWANALGAYRAMKKLSESERYNSKGFETVKLRELTKKEVENLWPDQGLSSKIDEIFRKTGEDKIYYTKEVFNPRLDGNLRIRKETFEAIKRFMEENKINKTGDGFSMLKALSGQKET